MKPLVLFGNGMFAEMLHFYFTTDAGRKVAGFTVDRDRIKEATFCGLPVVPFDEVEKHFPPQTHDMFVGVGYSKGTKFVDGLAVRKQKYFDALHKKYDLASFISSKAFVSQPELVGKNTIIMEGTFVMPFVHIGNNVVLYGCGIGHHAKIDDHTFFAGGHAAIGGGSHIKEGAFISLGATISNGITLGERSFIGVGAVISGNVADDAVYTAAPAELRRIKSNKIFT